MAWFVEFGEQGLPESTSGGGLDTGKFRAILQWPPNEKTPPGPVFLPFSQNASSFPRYLL